MAFHSLRNISVCGVLIIYDLHEYRFSSEILTEHFKIKFKYNTFLDLLYNIMLSLRIQYGSDVSSASFEMSTKTFIKTQSQLKFRAYLFLLAQVENMWTFHISSEREDVHHIVSYIPSESARARPGSEKGNMRSNCCAITVIGPPARVRFVFSYVNTFTQLRCSCLPYV